MSKMVSARVPDAVFDQVNAQLKAMGSSPSELINAAYEFLLSERQLPKAEKPKPKERKLSREQVEKLKRFFANSRMEIQLPDDVQDYREIAREARAKKYEALG